MCGLSVFCILENAQDKICKISMEAQFMNILKD